MIQLAIRCHPSVPLSAEELEPWLEQQVSHFRVAAPHGTIRLWRLTQELPSAEVDTGWLIELDLAEGEPLLAGDGLADAIRDMRLVGLQPTLLAPTRGGDRSRARSPNGAAA